MITKDRIDALFTKLRALKLTAKQDFQASEVVALWEIEQEEQAREARGKQRHRGYAFYHRADTELAFGEPVKVPGGSLMGTTMKHDLYITFGSMTGDPDEAKQIGKEICRSIQEAGLVWAWDGSTDKKIIIRNKERKKPLTKKT